MPIGHCGHSLEGGHGKQRTEDELENLGIHLSHP